MIAHPEAVRLRGNLWAAAALWLSAAIGRRTPPLKLTYQIDYSAMIHDMGVRMKASQVSEMPQTASSSHVYPYSHFPLIMPSRGNALAADSHMSKLS